MSGGNRSREVHNAATGETVRFVRTADETGGELLVMEAHWSRADHTTPAHVHPAMEERWKILEGSVEFEIDGVRSTAGPGETITAPPGVSHTNWNAGDGPALMRIEMRPPLRWEEFVRQLFALASEELVDDQAQRSIEELLTEFESEIKLP
jgi:quercetin dioxygenase-like cupin family protein